MSRFQGVALVINTTIIGIILGSAHEANPMLGICLITMAVLTLWDAWGGKDK